MKKEMPTQVIVAGLILLVGGCALGVEFLAVRLYPSYKQRVAQETLTPISFRNEALGIEMQVASGLYGKIETFSGGVRIVRSSFWGRGTTLTLTSQPNPDHATEFSPQILAKWETNGVYQEIPRYHFERTQIQNRDAVIIQEYKNRSMVLIAHVISPDRIIETECSTGDADEALYVEACDESLRTLKVEGPHALTTSAPGLHEAASPAGGTGAPR